MDMKDKTDAQSTGNEWFWLVVFCYVLIFILL